jgi:hypothetical protein
MDTYLKMKKKTKKKSIYLTTHEFYNKVYKLVEEFQKAIKKPVHFNVEIKK